MSLPTINGVIYDIEIAKAIKDKNRNPMKGIEYVTSWTDFKGMGIAVIAAYDLKTRMPRIFGPGNLAEVRAFFADRDEIIGFNSLEFDDKVLEAVLDVKVKTTYDLMREAKSACHEPLKYDRMTCRGGFSQDQLLKDNDLPVKLMKGHEAPMYWQLGHHIKVADYCLADVMLLYKLVLKRKALYVSSYDKTVELRELPSLREAQKHERQLAELAQREDW